MAEPEQSPAPEHPDRHVASHVFNIVMLLVGGGALAWMLYSLGWQQFLEVFRGVGWWFAVLIVIDLITAGFDAAALYAFLGPERRRVTYYRAYAAQLSGHALNLVTPGAGLGEVTKVTMLDSYASKSRVLSSIVLFNLVGLYISVAVIVIGTPITVLMVDLPSYIKWMVGIGLGVLVPLMVGIGILVRRGALSTLLVWARRVRFIKKSWCEKLSPKLADVDKHIMELQKGRTPGTRMGIVWVAASKLSTWTGNIVLIAAIGTHLHPVLIVGVLSIGTLIGWISSIVPLGLGLADGANYALYDLLGASGAHGVFFTLIGRARMVVIALLGLGVFAAMHADERFVRNKKKRARK